MDALLRRSRLFRDKSKQQLQFAKHPEIKLVSFWKNILCSDEYKFNVCGSDGRRPPTQELNPRYTIENLWAHVKNILTPLRTVRKSQGSLVRYT